MKTEKELQEMNELTEEELNQVAGGYEWSPAAGVSGEIPSPYAAAAGVSGVIPSPYAAAAGVSGEIPSPYAAAAGASGSF